MSISVISSVYLHRFYAPPFQIGLQDHKINNQSMVLVIVRLLLNSCCYTVMQCEQLLLEANKATDKTPEQCRAMMEI